MSDLQPSDPLLLPSAFAKRLGVHRETVWRWIKKGIIPFERIGPYQKIRIRESELESQRQRGTRPG